MTMLSCVFVGLLGLNVLTEVYLAYRQIRHVQAERNAVPAVFAATVPLDAHQKAADYTQAKKRLGMTSDIFAAGMLCVWTVGGGLNSLDTAWRATHTGPVTQGVLVIVSVLLLSYVVSLPLSIYGTFAIEARFGFNKITGPLYAADLLKSTLVSLVFAIPLCYAVLALMQRAGGLWWVYVWLLWSGFSLALLWLFPTLIAPLFNKFRPLEDQGVLTRVQNLLKRCGFASKGVFVMDGSRRSSHGNAYFTGFGRSKRVVFFDTLLSTLTVDEIEGVLAHELGHFKKRHVLQRLVTSFATSLIGLALLGWLTDKIWFYQGLGVQVPSAHAALLLLMLAAPVATFFLAPVSSWYSRRHEFEADTFAAQHAAAGALASALVKLYRDNATTLTPDAWHSRFYDSHPPALERIGALNKM